MSVTSLDRAEREFPIDAHVPIVVVGAGPTGLTLANLLGGFGARALLVERNEATVREPRAVSIDDESLRTMQAIGLHESVLETVVPGYGSDYLMPDGRCFLSVMPSGRPFGFPRRNAFRQPQLEALLQAGTRRFAALETLYGWTLEAFDQDDEGVTVRLVDKLGAMRRLRCDYLIGCDGAGSLVRRQLGLRLEGRSFEERWLIVDLARSPAGRRNTVVFCNTRRPCIALPGPQLTRRFEFKLHPHEREEDMLQAAVVQGLLEAHGAAPGSELVRKVVYTFHARVAPRWSEGRVFLAGDAAHLTPPFAGQGMNSGLRDSSNLGWKLACITQGNMPQALLATYEQERRKHVGQMIQLALRMGRIMSPRSRLRGFLMQHAFLAVGLWPAAKSFFGEMKYKPKPRFDAGFMQPDLLGPRRTLVGRMLPQPLVTSGEGREVLLDELLGNGFALLGIGVAPLELWRASQEPTMARLAPTAVLLAPLQGPAAASLKIAQLEHWPPELDAYRGQVLLIRPDRYVACSGSTGGARSIGAAVSELLRRFSDEHRPIT